MTDTTLLTAARGGDEDAYRELVDTYRHELHAHSYRMLGSVHDAEDALQEALLRAWRGLGRFEGRSSVRAWLYKIVTNVCLSFIERRPSRVLPTGLEAHAGEALWLEPYPIDDAEAAYEQRESLELAFVVALQQLPALQRAVLLLREVLGYTAREVAETLDTTVPAVNSALQRARKAVDEALPEPSQQVTLRALDDAELRGLVTQYVDAWEAGDIERIVSMLTEDAKFSMPPEPEWYDGLAAIRAFMPIGPLTVRWRFVPTWSNGQLAFGTYGYDPERDAYVPHAIDVLTLRGTKVSAITAFIDADIFPAYGLPMELPADAR
ncbi:sigma-70 family RNA polymerase sigma factor [Tenggerimyces flavus]|uniref:Sigma-70 family RNA polymerase sigma factor n=1 Tax=Tenggerimyces flavus TaxID=1708749 RepID=A0ABV7YDE9_9ACTN|nr:sigma-70 family RNA polymerase sigma factor [Tenggerimyces flavus]MBM7787168.1 RNA polymerase sigma-70 factor (ECF subfamily) [Tenggerimyces flavus]